MKMGRKSIGFVAAVAALSLSAVNFGGSAAASTWTPIRVLGSAGNSEPGIDIGLDKDGNEIVYVHGTRGLPSHNQAWSMQPDTESTFKQLTFTTPYNRLPGGGDADIAFRGDDLWFIDLWLGSNSIQYSPDKGKTWTQGTPFTTLPASDRQWIALGDTVIDSNGDRKTTVYVTWQQVPGGTVTWIARSRDNGLTWDFVRPITTAAADIGIPIHLVADGHRVVTAFNDGGHYTVAVSEDEGANWKLTPVSNTEDATGSLVGLTMNPDDSDELAISYVTSRSPTNKVVVRISRDAGDTWSNAIRMDPSEDAGFGGVDWFPWIDWKGEKLAVAWYQSSGSWPGRDPNTAPVTNKWHVYYSESIDDGETFSLPQQVTTAQAKNGGICTNGLGCNADRELGDFMQVAIDTHGNSWIIMTHVNAAPIPGQLGIWAYRQS